MSSATQYFGAVLNSIGDPLQSVYAGRPVEDPTSPKAMAIVMKWMKQCNEHPNCAVEIPPLPARVIDVGMKSTVTI
jgi:hypothetical protein